MAKLDQSTYHSCLQDGENLSKILDLPLPMKMLADSVVSQFLNNDLPYETEDEGQTNAP